MKVEERGNRNIRRREREREDSRFGCDGKEGRV